MHKLKIRYSQPCRLEFKIALPNFKLTGVEHRYSADLEVGLARGRIAWSIANAG